MIPRTDQAALQSSIDQVASESREIRFSLQAQYQVTRLEIVSTFHDLWLRDAATSKSRAREGAPTHSTKQQRANDEELLLSRLTNLNLQEEAMLAEHAFLDSLYYPQLEERHRCIKDVYPKTFEWIFEGVPGKLDTLDDFNMWLTSASSGLYWISGKAVAMKSTLMMCLGQDVWTIDRLNRCAGDSTLVIASFYFWNAGKAIQKSLIGLLQSLFYKILRSEPHLIPILFPWRWRMYERYEAVHEWTVQDFIDALQILKTHPL